MKVFLTTSPDRPGIEPSFLKTAKKLCDLGVDVAVDKNEVSAFDMTGVACRFFEERKAALEGCDYIIAVGGDGTIFHAAAEAMFYEKAVLGINAGRLGFLAQLEMDELDRLSEFLSGDYIIEERIVLEANLSLADGGTKNAYAVNDVVIARPDFGRVCDIEVDCNGCFVGSYRADGLIFATPTGSTAYSLSAGGPIADSTVSCIIMTPLASHSLVTRSIVFDGEKKLTVRSPECDSDAFFLIVDGKTIDAVSKNDIVTIKKSSFKTRFVSLNGRNFYQILTDKMKNRG